MQLATFREEKREREEKRVGERVTGDATKADVENNVHISVEYIQCNPFLYTSTNNYHL